ncbi:hypothetical protein POM88_007346 [Heracleum sosnowskyi]|uniref:Protein FAR1-RELATED SEQUENCE n=1 Tax=Heracleum sosnowskyi TaxID=360622 RepID=A0AAD8J6L8_9APIA|nr:hypothetical protein POM88_007346 [Heracleum sosnowskyi]
MKACVWSDYLTEDEFEQNWNAIIEEYQLSGNGWLNDMYTIRKEWIPAYFNDVSMAGLLRTTSRSESSNFYFQHFHRSGDTLVDFMKRYDSAMDRQRNLNAQNNRDSEFKFNSITGLKIDKDASRLYTRHLYYLVVEEIEATWHHTRIDDMSLVNDVKHFKVKDSLLNGKVFECNIDEIPRAFVMTRWTKNAEKRHDPLGSHEIPDYCAEVDEVKLLLNEIWFDFQSCMSAAGHDRERALKMRAHVNTMKDDMQGSTSQTGVRIHALIDDEPRSDVVVVQNPNISRNKGCGSRIKSGKEKSMDAINAKRRKCSKCGLAVGHNSRSCPGPTENVVVLTQSVTKENATTLTTSSA